MASNFFRTFFLNLNWIVLVLLSEFGFIHIFSNDQLQCAEKREGNQSPLKYLLIDFTEEEFS